MTQGKSLEWFKTSKENYDKNYTHYHQKLQLNKQLYPYLFFFLDIFPGIQINLYLNVACIDQKYIPDQSS